MLLAYVDESYDAARYWMVALVCPEHTIAPLTAALDAVVEKAAAAYGISFRAELHGHDLFQAKADWEPLAPMTRARIGVYHDAFDVIASMDVHVIIRGVDRHRLTARYAYPDHPHAVVLQHLLERVDECAERRYDGQPVLVIADQVDQADEYRKQLWRFQRQATAGYRARRLKHIVDTIHFAPSEASRLVQAADLIAFLARRIDARTGMDERADRVNDALWQRIETRVHHHHCWLP